MNKNTLKYRKWKVQICNQFKNIAFQANCPYKEPSHLEPIKQLFSTVFDEKSTKSEEPPIRKTWGQLPAAYTSQLIISYHHHIELIVQNAKFSHVVVVSALFEYFHRQWRKFMESKKTTPASQPT